MHGQFSSNTLLFHPLRLFRQLKRPPLMGKPGSDHHALYRTISLPFGDVKIARLRPAPPQIYRKRKARRQQRQRLQALISIRWNFRVSLSWISQARKAFGAGIG